MVNKSNKIRKFKMDPITARLNRIEGQVKGVKKMYEKDPCDYVGIAQQIKATRSALNQVSRSVLENEANRCVDEGDIKNLKFIIKKTFGSTLL